LLNIVWISFCGGGSFRFRVTVTLLADGIARLTFEPNLYKNKKDYEMIFRKGHSRTWVNPMSHIMSYVPKKVATEPLYHQNTSRKNLVIMIPDVLLCS
jgi:hypothetical protein